MAGAEYLQSIFGTEKDKVNCPFYFKIGACRHGDKCERRHNKPTLSQTLIFFNMYPNPLVSNPNANPNDKKALEAFEDFYEDIYDELISYGEIDELNVCDNICDHMIGNVYVKYHTEDGAEKALKALTGRFYGGKPIVAEFSPVTDFREASCRQYETHECTRGGHCNFVHLKPISRDLYRRLFSRRRRRSRSRERRRSKSRERHIRRSRSRSKERRRKSRSPRKDKDKEKDREKDRDKDRDKDREKDRDRDRDREKEDKRRKMDREERSSEGRQESRSDTVKQEEQHVSGKE